ncbi:hypothetical protein IA539_00095 [Gordonia sp. zg691]|uniref:hypothetical protein n=1 Tax=Gordonia jinghuaiqii TaxID=2758710 RepID=UPI0016626026|nr:hypothetical protein [Gordonia jinghuaiqii]MBD0859619.1 hypothetical protein [Gordonia jinghuaiqii]
MRTAFRTFSYGIVGYLLLLLAFASMGLFVDALAGGMAYPAWPFGVALAVLIVTSFAAFRAQVDLSAHTKASDGAIISPDPLIPALRRADIDRYEAMYRHHEVAGTQPDISGSRIPSAA